jgi:hypothetical protein
MAFHLPSHPRRRSHAAVPPIRDPNGLAKEGFMPRGDKSSYTSKQKRQAEHIEEGYEKRGLGEEEAERRAWATVNKMTGGGKKSGSGRGKEVDKAPAKKGGRKGGAASAARPASARSAAAKKAAATRKRNAAASTTRRSAAARKAAKGRTTAKRSAPRQAAR